MTDTLNEQDPRCPYCHRPVLGTYVAGKEGRYHPRCVEPPATVEHQVGSIREAESNVQKAHE
jgi:hypothetical protein